MAVHYYNEDSIKDGKKLKCNVVVNHTVESKAITQAFGELSKKKKLKKQPKENPNQMTFFESL